MSDLLRGDHAISERNQVQKQTDKPEETNGDEAPGRRMDAELKIIGAMLRMLDDLDEPAKSRVVAYLVSRYQGRE